MKFRLNILALILLTGCSPSMGRIVSESPDDADKQPSKKPTAEDMRRVLGAGYKPPPGLMQECIGRLIFDVAEPFQWPTYVNGTVDGPAGAASQYLVIDGVFVPGMHRLVNAVLPSPQVTTLLFEKPPACSDKTRDISPFIAPYHASYARLQTLLDRCSGWPMISAIETAESQAALTERLAAWCVVEVGGQRFNFRFPDTRRLPAIFDALMAKQGMEFAGPATRWSYVDRNGSWADLAVPGTPGPIAERPELDDRQFVKLVSASEVDEVISILHYRGHSIAGRHSDNYACLAIALRAANKINLTARRKSIGANRV